MTQNSNRYDSNRDGREGFGPRGRADRGYGSAGRERDYRTARPGRERYAARDEVRTSHNGYAAPRDDRRRAVSRADGPARPSRHGATPRSSSRGRYSMDPRSPEASQGRRPATAHAPRQQRLEVSGPSRAYARGGAANNRRPQQRGRIDAPTGPRGLGISLARGAAAARRANGEAITKIIGICVAAALVIVAILLWSNRSVDITLNGSKTSVRIGSTVEQVIASAQLTPKAGNLISVSGNKLEDGTGYPFLAKLSGNEMDGAATESYRVAAGDDLAIEDGRDRTEDYDVQVVEEDPKLEMGGDAWGNITYVSQWPSKGRYEMRTGRQSGETARGETLEETKNAIVSVRQIKPDDGRKLVCLTFDDGPASSYTEKYLEILNKYNIHATFFNLGSQIEEYPDLAKKIVEQGSEVMSHTQQHQQLSLLDSSALQKEFSDTFTAIESATGVKTTAFRPPYGDFTEKAWLNSGGLASVSVLWNQDSLDWKLPGVDALVSNALKNVTSGSIILMHDGGGKRDQDVQALPQIIEKLQAQGYEFVTVTELMKSDSSIPADVAAGDATMPEGSTWPTEIASDDASASSGSGSSGSSSGSSSSSSTAATTSSSASAGTGSSTKKTA